MLRNNIIKPEVRQQLNVILSTEILPKGPEGNILRHLIFSINPLPATVKQWVELVKVMKQQMPEKTKYLNTILEKLRGT